MGDVMLKPRSAEWTPVLSSDGVFFCSPRCGACRHCRKEWYDDAIARAGELADRMGAGWVPDVWENLGWHYDVSNGIGRITTSRDYRHNGHVHYTAWINARDHQFIVTNGDPEEAWGLVVQDARTFISRLQSALASILAGESAP